MANRASVMRRVKGEWIAEDVARKNLRKHSVGVDPHREDGGKRKGKSMKREVREDLSGTLLRRDLLRVRDIDPSAEITTVAKGRRVKMIRYFDPSVKRSA